MTVSQNDIQNVLLRTLSPADFATIASAMERVALKSRHVLVQEDCPITQVFFPDSGLCSKVAVSPDREFIEVGVFGRDGVSDMPCELGQRSPLRIVVQAPGEAWLVDAVAIIDNMTKSSSFLRLLLKYQLNATTQAAFTALSHGSYNVPERLARWLLMCQDRLGEQIPMVHEFLAMMLAVRRSGVTETLHLLEATGAIQATRGRIVIKDRDRLIELSEGSYGAPEREYEELIGSFGRPTS